LMLPKLCGSDVPFAATAVPMSGGHCAAHDPEQFDCVAVSLANQYNVNPAAFTSTVPLLVVIALIASEPDPALADAPFVGLPLLPQAASNTAAAARLGPTHQRLRMTSSPSCCENVVMPALRSSGPHSCTTS